MVPARWLRAKRVQYDGHRYLQIAREGYEYRVHEQSTIAWFPGYPLAIRLLGTTGLDLTIAAFAISLAGGAAVASLWRRWLEDVAGLSGNTLVVAWCTLMLYPFSWYLYGVVYADAMFVAATLGVFLLVEHRRPVLAGLVGIVVTATRPTGVAVVIGAFVLQLVADEVLVTVPDGRPWQRFRLAPRRFRPVDAAPLLGFAGVGAYIVYLAVRFDAPFAFVDNQREFRAGATPIGNLSGLVALRDGWSHATPAKLAIAVVALLSAGLVAWTFRRRLSPKGWGVLLLAGGLLALAAGRWRDFVEFPLFRTTTAVQAGICLFVLLSVPRVVRRFGPGYGALTAVMVAIPTISTGDFMGAGRYVIAAFPVAALWGEQLAARPRLRTIVLVGQAALLVAVSIGFVMGYYLA